MRMVSAIFGFAFAVAASLFIRQLGTALMGGDVYLYAPGASLLISLCLGILATSLFTGRRGGVKPSDDADPSDTGDAISVSPLCYFLTICGMILPATIILIKATPWLFITPADPVYEIRRAIAMCFLMLLPAGLGGGIALRLLFRSGSKEERAEADVDLALIGAGGFVGGLAFSLLLAEWAPPLQLAGASGFLLAAAGFALWLSRENNKGVWGCLMAPVALVLFAVAIPPVGSVLDFAVTKIRLPGHVLLENNHSAFAEMDAVAPVGGRRVFEDAEALKMRGGLPQTGDARLFIFGGLPVGANYDIEHAEETAHLALASHPSPRNVLVVGGGASGVVYQALHHPTVERIDYVEIDPAFASFVVRNSTGELADALGSSRVVVHDGIDGVSFLRDSDGAFDVIILDIPDPTTAVFSRYYTADFMRDARARLTKGGVVTVNLTGGGSYMSRARKLLINSVTRNLISAFDSVSIIDYGGFRIFIMERDGALDTDADSIRRRLEERGAPTRWLTAEKIEELLPQIPTVIDVVSDADAAANSRLSSLSYRYSTTYRPPRFDGKQAASIAARWDLRHYGILIWALAFSATGVAMITRRRRLISCPALALFTGAAASGLAVTLLMMFQAYYGTAYGYIGLFIGAAMIGLGAGAECGSFAAKSEGRRTFMLAATLALGGCALMLPSALITLHDASDAAWAGRPAFVAVMIFVFWLVGVATPIARSIYGKVCESDDIMDGMLFWLLLGAGVGALLTGALFVPFMGPALSACAAAFIAFGGATQFVLSE